MMLKSIVLYFTALIVVSCGSGQTAVQFGPVKAILPDKTQELDETGAPIATTEFSIITPGTFHAEDLPALDTGLWSGLYVNNGKALIETVQLIVTAVHDNMLDKEGEKTAKKLEVEPDGALFLIDRLPNGEVPLIEQNIGSIFPGNDVSFNYYGREFTIGSKSEHIGDEGDFEALVDYQMTLSAVINAEERSQIIASTYRFDAAEMSVLFIGDLDRDGWPDLIINTSPKYSYRQITLFLSGPATGKDLVKEVASFTATSC